MPKIFTDENRDELRIKLLDKGFKMLKKGGLSAVNIDKLTEDTYIAKGTFYNLFENKSLRKESKVVQTKKQPKTIR